MQLSLGLNPFHMWVLGVALLANPLWAAEDYSNAETQLFMQPHFQHITLPSQLLYRFKKSGNVEQGFEDSVTLTVNRLARGGCCQAQVEFLSGEHRLQLPSPEQALGNPVILYFLEHDIRDMQRLTHGKSNYFRARIRKALYQSATEYERQWRYKGTTVAATVFEIAPFADDPLRSRYAQWADKRYLFAMSKAVPGHVLAIRSWVNGAQASSPFWQETLLIEGASL